MSNNMCLGLVKVGKHKGRETVPQTSECTKKQTGLVMEKGKVNDLMTIYPLSTKMHSGHFVQLHAVQVELKHRLEGEVI